MSKYIKELVPIVNSQVDEKNVGDYKKLDCEEVIKEDESLEELKSKAIFLKINEKQFLSEQIFRTSSDKIEMEDITHYTVEARKIAINWEKEREKSDY